MTAQLTLAEVRTLRLRAQGLRFPSEAPTGAGGERTAADVVRRALAVQAQEYLPAQWGLAQRLPPAIRPDAAGVAAAIDRGDILRTHVLRPTWHFTTPADAAWLMPLSAERVHRANGTMYRAHGLTGATAARAVDMIADAVATGHRTRGELAEAAASAGLPSTGVGFGYVLALAELERAVISGASVGKQRTYAAWSERVPDAAPLPRADALARLAERYLDSRGPASVRDLATWSGFTQRDARAALVDAADRTDGAITTVAGPDDEELWHDVRRTGSAAPDGSAGGFAVDGSADGGDDGVVDLVQAYDEYVMGYAPPRAYLAAPEGWSAETMLHAMLADGRLVGRWAPVVHERAAVVRIVEWREASARERASRDARVAEVERFLGVPVTVRMEGDAAAASSGPGGGPAR